jgi:hypothetical protein
MEAIHEENHLRRIGPSEESEWQQLSKSPDPTHSVKSEPLK